MATNYIIVSKLDYITFTCPHCHDEVEIPFSDVDYKTDYWGDGAWCDCLSCEKEVELDEYEYD